MKHRLTFVFVGRSSVSSEHASKAEAKAAADLCLKSWRETGINGFISTETPGKLSLVPFHSLALIEIEPVPEG